MKVFILKETNVYNDYIDSVDIISVSKTKPELPDDKEDGCGCCYSRYSIEEKELQQ